MGVKTLFGVMLAVFVFSYIYIGLIMESPEPPKAAAYIVEEPQMKIFIIEEHPTSAWSEKTSSEKHKLNVKRYKREYKDELEEFEMKNKLKNVIRSVDGELIIGYSKEIDNPGFESID